jgi:hypothetical protein
MKYFLLILLFTSFALSSKEKKSIYVYKILTKNTKDPNFESKFRNKMTGILLKDFSDYNLMDDDSIAGLKAKLEKSKMFGCNEEACMREISRSLNADEVITGTIEENNGKFRYSFKNSARVKKGEENLSIKSLADGEFYFNQWEYFTGEIVRKLMNPSYTLNYKDAPPYENIDEFNYVTVKDLKEIKLPEIKGNTLDIVKIVRDTISNADSAYNKKDYRLALDGFRDARDTLANLSPEDKKKVGDMSNEVQNRIYLTGDSIFAKRLGELDTHIKENSPMSLKALNKSKGIEGWKSLYEEYKLEIKEGERNPSTEKRILKNISEMTERKYRLLMEDEMKSGEEKMLQQKYDSSIAYFEAALEVVKKSEGFLGEKENSILVKKLSEAKAKRWNPEMENTYSNAEKKLDQFWKEDRFDDFLEEANRTRDSLNELKIRGGDREELLQKIREKIKFYDLNSNSAKSSSAARKWNPEMETLYSKIEKKSEDLWKNAEYAEYDEYLRVNLSQLRKIKSNGGTRDDLISNVNNKINQFGNRLRAEENVISEKISLYRDATLVDESYNKKIEKEKEKENLRSAQLRNFLEPKRFHYSFLHFPGFPQEREEMYKYGSQSLKSSFFSYAGYASLLVIGYGSILYQVDNSEYRNLAATDFLYYYTFSYREGRDYGQLLLALDQVKFNSAYSRVETSAGVINGGIGLFGFFLLLSNIDLYYSSKKFDSLSRGESIPILPLEKGKIEISAKYTPKIPGYGNLGNEMFYNLEYNYQF